MQLFERRLLHQLLQTHNPRLNTACETSNYQPSRSLAVAQTKCIHPAIQREIIIILYTESQSTIRPNYFSMFNKNFHYSLPILLMFLTHETGTVIARDRRETAVPCVLVSVYCYIYLMSQKTTGCILYCSNCLLSQPQDVLFFFLDSYKKVT